MDIRSELNEFLQQTLHQNPHIYFSSRYDGSKKKYIVSLYIWSQEWASDPSDSIKDGRNAVIEKALEELKLLETERAIRVRLRMGDICRNPHLMSMRRGLKSLKRSYRDYDKIYDSKDRKSVV